MSQSAGAGGSSGTAGRTGIITDASASTAARGSSTPDATIGDCLSAHAGTVPLSTALRLPAVGGLVPRPARCAPGRSRCLTESGVIDGFVRRECAAFGGVALPHAVRWNGAACPGRDKMSPEST